MRSLCEVAKEICDEFGIAWDENATTATLCSETVTESVLRACLLRGYSCSDAMEIADASRLFSYDEVMSMLQALEFQLDTNVQFDKE